MSALISGLAVLLSAAGLSFIVAFAARFGWDTAGLHTRKAPHVTNTFLRVEKELDT